MQKIIQETIESIPVSSDSRSKTPTQALDHLPGAQGHWLTGNISQLMPNPLPSILKWREAFGECFTVGFLFNGRALMMVGPEANELLLIDREHNFSSRWGWEIVHPFFGQNILVRDFEDHHVHRKLMTHVFKAKALALYLEQMLPIIESSVARYEGQVDCYKETKKMALDVALRIFMGITSGEHLDVWNHDLSIVLSNVMAHRVRLPGTKYWRALAARDRTRQRLLTEISARRGNSGEDLFSRLVNQRDDKGRALSEQDVVDHMFGILFAAHDTTASSLAMIFWLLAENSQWQSKARAECLTLYEKTGSTNLAYEYMNELPIIDAIFKETLRMYAPIQLVPRRSVKAFSFKGRQVPANTWILLAPQATHFDPVFYDRPNSFDPGRFLAAGDRLTPFSFVPFGNGSHMCLGMHFAYMEVKAVLYRLLLTQSLEKSTKQKLNLQYLPIVSPVGELKVDFLPLHSNRH
ncbi:MAG: cytochrome P450 [Candidatus Azotimanducaceae bacterium]|jgi:cytochrome P450